ncbi:MAG TPA: hypothetical protein PLA74_10565 [Syntrophales bacterium]|nr:hypothetical protein [Syntrophales bacterium]
MRETKHELEETTPADAGEACLEVSFWHGYQRGLNRRRFGKIFAATDDAVSPDAVGAVPDDDSLLEEAARRTGYLHGVEGLPFEAAAERFKEFLRKIHSIED